MSTTVIVLIVIGLIFIFVSFALSEKLSEEKEESAGVVKIPKELTQEQNEKIDTLIAITWINRWTGSLQILRHVWQRS